MSKFALLAALAAFAVGTSVALKTAPVDTLKSARIRAKARLREALAVDDKVSNPDAMTSVKTHNESIDDVVATVVSMGLALAEHGCTPDALRAYEAARRTRVGLIATAAIEQTGRYYKQKDDSANPFKPNPKELSKYIAEFKQEPVPSHLPHKCGL